MHNGNGHGNGHGQGHGPGNGNGKRWLLIGLLVLGGFWLVNDSYQDGYTDALVQTGQAQTARFYRGGPDFPWGLVILGGIGYIAWRKGAFDRFGGPGGPFAGGDNGERGVQRYGGDGPAQSPGPMFRGPRAYFEAWHREAHESYGAHEAYGAYGDQRAQHQAPAVPQAPPVPSASPAAAAAPSGNGVQDSGYVPTPPPPPPAPDYWASMARAADAPGTAGNSAETSPAVAAPPRPQTPADGAPGTSGASGPALERW